jgi:hypothetical protein
MTASQLHRTLRNFAGQVRAPRPPELALPCAAMALAMLATAISARAPEGPKCAEATVSAPGFDSLSPPAAPAACIRIRF